MSRVGIVICNYNKCNDVLKCIQSVQESKYTDYDLYVVDNASTDQSVKMIQEKYKNQLQLIVNCCNLGGSGGFNMGLRKAAADGHEYLYCLDNDVLVDENAIGELVTFLDAHQDTAMAGSRVYQMEEPAYIQQFGQVVDFDEYCTEAKYLGWTDDENIPDVEYSDAVAACSLMVRKSLTDEIGMMPEENFLYWDDTEWGYKCNLAGYKVASVGSSVVLHRMGAKKESENTFPTYYAWRNWIRFFIKYTPEEKLEEMCDVFLKSVFDVIYEGMYRGEKNKAMTVMYAYDDAIHNVTGPAKEGRIFKLDTNNERLRKLLRGKHCVRLVNESESGKDFSCNLETELKSVMHDIEVTTDAAKPADLELVLCDNIFEADDMNLKKIYIDQDFNLFSSDEDALKIINYRYSLESFRYANRPLFLKLAKEMRNDSRQKVC